MSNKEYIEKIRAMGYQIESLEYVPKAFVRCGDYRIAQIWEGGIDLFYGMAEDEESLSAFRAIMTVLGLRKKLQEARIPFEEDSSIGDLKQIIQGAQKEVSKLIHMLDAIEE